VQRRGLRELYATRKRDACEPGDAASSLLKNPTNLSMRAWELEEALVAEVSADSLIPVGPRSPAERLLAETVEPMCRSLTITLAG
jgi:hypothetical protein